MRQWYRIPSHIGRKEHFDVRRGRLHDAALDPADDFSKRGVGRREYADFRDFRGDQTIRVFDIKTYSI